MQVVSERTKLDQVFCSKSENFASFFVDFIYPNVDFLGQTAVRFHGWIFRRATVKYHNHYLPARDRFIGDNVTLNVCLIIYPYIV